MPCSSNAPSAPRSTTARGPECRKSSTCPRKSKRRCARPGGKTLMAQKRPQGLSQRQHRRLITPLSDAGGFILFVILVATNVVPLRVTNPTPQIAFMYTRKEFRKYVGHQGIQGTVVDDVISHIYGPENMTRTVIEERNMPFREVDVFSRLMADRIIFLAPASTITSPTSSKRNSCSSSRRRLEGHPDLRQLSGVSVYAGLGIYDTMQYISPDVATICTGGRVHGGCPALCGAAGKRTGLKHSRDDPQPSVVHADRLRTLKSPPVRSKAPKSSTPSSRATPARPTTRSGRTRPRPLDDRLGGQGVRHGKRSGEERISPCLTRNGEGPVPLLSFAP